jgi:DNA repair protein RecO (recombination protein O)
MSYIKTKGIVLREVDTGEADKIITVFSRNKGKISCSAKGARRSKSRLAAGTQLFCYGEFVLFKGKEIYSINSCDVIESFYNIRNDLQTLTYSAHMTDIIIDVIQEEQPATKVLQLFLNSLFMLAKTDKPPEQVIRIFELRILSILGYAPSVRGCINCDNEDMGHMYFSFQRCGYICGKCIDIDKSAKKISTGAARAINHIVYTNIKSLFNFEVSQEVLKEIENISRRYLRERLDKDYKKLDFLKTLNL